MYMYMYMYKMYMVVKRDHGQCMIKILVHAILKYSCSQLATFLNLNGTSLHVCKPAVMGMQRWAVSRDSSTAN